jgi:hypothetical protein
LKSPKTARFCRSADHRSGISTLAHQRGIFRISSRQRAIYGCVELCAGTNFPLYPLKQFTWPLFCCILNMLWTNFRAQTRGCLPR